MSIQFMKIRNGTSYPGLAADPSDPQNGDLYYNTTSQVFRQYTNGVWSNLGSGAVTTVSVNTANGLAGTSSGGTTPALTLSTTVTGILSGNGTAISAASTTGSGSVVLATSPTLVTPALGTPSSVVLTNATGTASSLTAGLATALAGGSTNAIPYQTASGATSFLAQGSGVLQESAGVPSWTLAPTFTTQPSYDQSTKAATDAYVWNVSSLFMAYVPLSGITSGTYSFASNGSAAVVNVTASGGVITAVSFVNGGSGFAVGDIITCTSNSGNHDSFIVITSVSGTAAATASVLYGGTGYVSGTGGSISSATTAPFTFSLTGTLTGPVTLLMTPGTYLTQGNQWIFMNNTTGAYTVTVKMSNGSDTAIGTGVVIPQGTNNSTPIYVTTDGETDVWYGDTPVASRLSGQLSLTSQVSGILPIANGGTNQSSLITTPTASTIPAWDANKNLSANNHIEGYATIATAASTTTLTVSSAYQQYFTGTTTQTVVLPVTSTLVLGQQFQIFNNSTGAVTVESSGSNVIQVMAANTQLTLTVVSTSLTTAAAWNAVYVSGIAAVINPTVQKFTTGSGTYTTPSGVQYIRVRAIGPGAGGSGSGSGGTAGNSGSGATTFGTSLISAGAGNGSLNQYDGGTGGTASLGSGPIGLAFTGSGGTAGTYNLVAAQGGAGGSGPMGGGGGGLIDGSGNSGAANTGSGGGGSGLANGVTNTGGGGGGAGGFVDAIISSPAATYAYSVGSGGSGGSAGTSGHTGGAGAAGYIEVTEFYTNYQVGTTTSVAANTFLAGPSSGSNANPTFRSLATNDFIAPTLQKFTSGSGTYTLPISPRAPLYISVRMVGGGGGGGGASTTGGAGGSGGNTTFGSSLLVANGGGGGNSAQYGGAGVSGGAGGTASLGSGPIGTAITGGTGGPGMPGIVGGSYYGSAGGNGGSSPFGGSAGGGSAANIASQSGSANSGSGGGGGGDSASGSGNSSGSGGGAGGFVDVIITSPSSTYSYAVGSGGTSGSGNGSSGGPGGAGGSGVIIVTEYYQ